MKVTNPIQQQMIERNEFKNIGQIWEIGEERMADLQTVRGWENRCGSCNLIHRGDCW